MIDPITTFLESPTCTPSAPVDALAEADAEVVDVMADAAVDIEVELAATAAALALLELAELAELEDAEAEADELVEEVDVELGLGTTEPPVPARV